MTRKRNAIAKDLRTPKYRPRVVQDKREKHNQQVVNREIQSHLVKKNDTE